MSKLDVVLVKENYELFTMIQNEKRKQLLSFIYLQSRKYKDLIEFSGLKPGSLYHHLNILEPLIEKRGHGSYYITELGKNIVEQLDLVDSKNVKPKINTSTGNLNPTIKNNGTSHNIEKSITLDDKLSLIWLGRLNYVILSTIVLVSIIMATEGVALAGSAIYATGPGIALKFDLMALIIGVLAMYTIETLRQPFEIYNRFQFILIIRLMSMLPGTVISIGLLLLFSSDVVPSVSIYPVLFGISLMLGTITSAIGISYLRGQSLRNSFDLAILVSTIDLLLGIIVLIS